MKFNSKTYNLLIIIVILLFSSACSSEPICRKGKDVTLGMTLYVDSINPATGRWEEERITVSPLTVQGIGVDSLLLNEASASAIQAPLNQFVEQCQFLLQFGSVRDTLTLHYKNNIELLSLECGAIYTHYIESAHTSGHFIDSITIIEPNVNTLHVENIKLHHLP